MKKFIKLIIFILITALGANTYAVATNFDFNGKTSGTPLPKIKESNALPYVDKLKPTNPFYLNNDILDPVFRLKLDEGKGNIITESVSGRTAEIIGDDYEWVQNARIRYGCSVPIKYRSNTALRLNNSYVNLGKFEDLDIKDEATIVFWTNFEIKGRNDSYVEPDWHNSLTYGSYGAAYKYDKNATNVILQCGNARMCIKQKNIILPGIGGDTTYSLPNALVCNDYYNMYFLTVKIIDGQANLFVYGNDNSAINSQKTVYNWGKATFGSDTLYLGTPNPSGSTRSCELGIADLMIFNRALTYQERLMLYYGYNQMGYVSSSIPQ